MLETQLKDRLTILNTFEWFTYFWNKFEEGMYDVRRTMHSASVAINNGDCAVAALAVSSVLNRRLDVDVGMARNTLHAWVTIGSDIFDTEYPTGHDISSFKSKWGDRISEVVLTPEVLVEEFMPCDLVGAYLVKEFCGIMGELHPKEIDFLLSNPSEYESPEGISKIGKALAFAVEETLKARRTVTTIKHESYFTAKEATMDHELKDHVRDIYSGILICVLVDKNDYKVIGESYRKGPETERTLLARSRAKFIALDKLKDVA